MKINHSQVNVLTIFSVAIGLAFNVHAEGFSLDSINQGLSKVQKTTEALQKTTEAAQQTTETIGGTLDSASKTVKSGQAAASQAVQSGQQTLENAAPGTLTETLVNKLGVTAQQAQGGAGAIFQAAKSQLDSEQFAALTNAVPEMDTLLSAAPKQSESLKGLAGGVSSLLGDDSSTFGNLAGLASSFKQLNLSPDMVDNFVPVVVDYVRNNGGAMTADMLQSTLYSN